MQEMAAQGITDPREQAMFLAQMDHETGGFRQMEESFNYRSADQVMAVSRTARNAGAEAVEAALARGPQAVAELMYGGRNGNTGAGDGYKYRGRGFTQLTGRANYAQAGQALGLDLLNNPDLAKDPEIAAKIATWYWKSRGASGAARAGDVTAVTRMINGGTNGLADRNAQYSTYLGQIRSGAINAQTPTVPMARAAGSAAPALERVTPQAAPSVPTPIGSNDRGGSRTEVTIPLQIGQNIGLLVATAVMMLIALGNGLGSGIVMTLGADASPVVGRAQFLGGWRLCGDIGNSGGPLLVSAVAAVAPLAGASVVLGVLLLVGTWWVGRPAARVRPGERPSVRICRVACAWVRS